MGVMPMNVTDVSDTIPRNTDEDFILDMIILIVLIIVCIVECCRNSGRVTHYVIQRNDSAPVRLEVV
jgi:hypothetical protein